MFKKGVWKLITKQSSHNHCSFVARFLNRIKNNNRYELKILGMNKIAKYIKRRAISIFQYFFRIKPINPAHNKGRYKAPNTKVIKTCSWLWVKINHNQNEEYAILIILIITVIAFSLFSIFSFRLIFCYKSSANNILEVICN